ncbi:KfrB domain-containing protein (plasmid) [Achromobacter sp. CF-sbj1-Ac2-l]|uniref:KfrB domain-containing protein n=1 Tax=Achromobacter TaxID=222 RepID=UPI0006C3F51A|nr:hypothetical protein [Achromobacter xylosoxidans]CUJ63966.1 Uncharacterised protein [Achromobacter xylosoxidans]
MTTKRMGKMDVEFNSSGVGFTVKGAGLQQQFQVLADFHIAAEAAGLSGTKQDAIAAAVHQHFSTQHDEAPLDSENLPLAFLSLEAAVSVQLNRGTMAYEVGFPFHPDIVRSMRGVPGAKFLSDAKVWSVPLEARNALLPALEFAGQTLVEQEEARQAVMAQLSPAAGKFAAGEIVKVSDFHRKDWIYSGEIVAANLHYAAQLTSRAEGEASIVIHQQSALDRQVFVGDNTGIKYTDKGRASVLTAQQTRAEFAGMSYDKLIATLGEKIDGVTVTRRENGDMLVAIEHHSSRPAMPLHRMDKFLNGADKVSFDVDLKSFVVPSGALNEPGAPEVFGRAVADARREIREDTIARKEVLAAAKERLTGAKVSFPIPRAPEWQEGTILYTNDRYALQASGREFMKAHELRNLAESPTVGQLVKISYQPNGKALVEERQQTNNQSKRVGGRHHA